MSDQPLSITLCYEEGESRTIPVLYPDKSILENLELAGVQMKHQCRNGFCGSCRCRLLSGDVEYLKEPLGFAGESEVLICVSKAKMNLFLKA